MIYKKLNPSIAIPARKIRSCDCGDANAQDQRYYTISNFFCEGQGAWRNINDVANVYNLDCDFVLNALAKIHQKRRVSQQECMNVLYEMTPLLRCRGLQC